MRRPAALLVALCATWGCDDLPQDPVLAVTATGQVSGTIFLDANGTREQDAGDVPVPGLAVELRTARTGAVAGLAISDSAGRFRLADVPVGEYRLSVDLEGAADSLEILNLSEAPFRLNAFDSLGLTIGLTYPEVSVEEARALPPGRLVFTSGIVLNNREPFGDGVVHLQGDSLNLRSTSVARASISAGDSARFLGRTARDAGQPILQDVTPFLLVSQAAVPRRVEVTPSVAADAGGGRLDAALVIMRQVEIADTATDAGGDFLVSASDANGSVVIVFRRFLSTPHFLFDSASVRIASVVGLLRPRRIGDEVVWRIFPRSLGDVALEAKPEDDPDAPSR